MPTKALHLLPEFAGCNTSTEFLAKVLFDRMAICIREGRLGASAAGLTALRMTLHESHLTWAAFEAELSVS